jgi:redox-sensitive bicupin YhaK (pirin superfamily)
MIGTDPWNMSGEGEHALIVEGQLQWGRCSGGTEHGMRFDESYHGPSAGFQLWVNLRAENKMGPPVFQNARPEVLPLLAPAPLVAAKLFVGELHGAVPPVDTMGIRCQYVDYMLEPGGEATHPHPSGMTALFVYVYDSAGSFGSSLPVVSAQGEVMSLGPSGDVALRADQGVALGCLLIAGEPLKEPIVQHGPFAMSTRAQIVQAFEEYQRGVSFVAAECEYRLHEAGGTEVIKRQIDPTYRSRR